MAAKEHRENEATQVKPLILSVSNRLGKGWCDPPEFAVSWLLGSLMIYRELTSRKAKVVLSSSVIRSLNSGFPTHLLKAPPLNLRKYPPAMVCRRHDWSAWHE